MTINNAINSQQLLAATSSPTFANLAVTTQATVGSLTLSGVTLASSGAINITPASVMAGIALGGNVGISTGGNLAMYEATNTHATIFSAGAITGNTNYTYPLAYPGSNGYMLSSTTGGTMSWVAPGTGAVASIAGTTNEITASASTGAVTLSIPSGFVAPGTISVGNLKLDTNTLSSTNSNGNIDLTPNGSGINVLANAQVTSLTISEAVFTDASKNLVSNAITGSGNVVMSTSPTLVTPVLGTPTSGNLANCTGYGALRSVQVLTSGSAATYTKPAGILNILVECLGGGGGGGGVGTSAGGYASSGGGGSGGYCKKLFLSAAGTYTYTIGAAGSAGTAGVNNGGTGGTTSFDTLSCVGGSGGIAFASSVTVGVMGGPGGNGGTASNGNVNFSGSPGSPALTATSGGTTSTSGSGGSSYFGGGANGVTSGGSAGTAATNNSGAGGSGAASAVNASTFAGGAGGSGLIIVWEFA